MNSLGKSPSKKKNKKNNWGKKPEVDREKIRAQTKQYYQDQYQEKEFLLKNTHNKEARSQLYDDNTLDYKKLTKPKGKNLLVLPRISTVIMPDRDFKKEDLMGLRLELQMIIERL